MNLFSKEKFSKKYKFMYIFSWCASIVNGIPLTKKIGEKSPNPKMKMMKKW
jgi:hypothetical protein